jgi:protein-S-isoprenylcysteine O-methyltransferase Ste14
MENFLRNYLPIFLFAYLLITFVLPSVRVYKQTGINPVTFGKSDNAHDYIGGVMKFLTALLIGAVLLFSISPNAYSYLNPFAYLQNEWLTYTGLIIVHLALIWIIVAQYHMRQSWRIGIDNTNKTALITIGLFSISRNPVFLGMILSTAGIFLILPNAIMLLITVTSYIVIQIQIRLEEEHLQKMHGSDYNEYKRKVKRLL